MNFPTTFDFSVLEPSEYRSVFIRRMVKCFSMNDNAPRTFEALSLCFQRLCNYEFVPDFEDYCRIWNRMARKMGVGCYHLPGDECTVVGQHRVCFLSGNRAQLDPTLPIFQSIDPFALSSDDDSVFGDEDDESEEEDDDSNDDDSSGSSDYMHRD
jgi:hypothetical protein